MGLIDMDKEILKHFALIELGNDEAMSIGIIQNIPDSPQGVASFEARFREACGTHFDFYLDEIELKIPDLFCGTPYEDVDISIDCYLSGVHETYTVRIMETWIY